MVDIKNEPVAKPRAIKFESELTYADKATMIELCLANGAREFIHFDEAAFTEYARENTVQVVQSSGEVRRMVVYVNNGVIVPLNAYFAVKTE